MIEDPNFEPKAIAAVLGALTAIVFQPPKTIKDTISKFVVSVTFAYMTGVPTARHFGLPTQSIEDIMTAAYVIGLFAWVLVATLMKVLPAIAERFLSAWKPKG